MPSPSAPERKPCASVFVQTWRTGDARRLSEKHRAKKTATPHPQNPTTPSRALAGSGITVARGY